MNDADFRKRPLLIFINKYPVPQVVTKILDGVSKQQQQCTFTLGWYPVCRAFTTMSTIALKMNKNEIKNAVFNGKIIGSLRVIFQSYDTVNYA